MLPKDLIICFDLERLDYVVKFVSLISGGGSDELTPPPPPPPDSRQKWSRDVYLLHLIHGPKIVCTYNYESQPQQNSVI